MTWMMMRYSIVNWMMGTDYPYYMNMYKLLLHISIVDIDNLYTCTSIIWGKQSLQILPMQLPYMPDLVLSFHFFSLFQFYSCRTLKKNLFICQNFFSSVFNWSLGDFILIFQQMQRKYTSSSISTVSIRPVQKQKRSILTANCMCKT